jgi:hypothetical protein
MKIRSGSIAADHVVDVLVGRLDVDVTDRTRSVNSRSSLPVPSRKSVAVPPLPSAATRREITPRG